MTRVYFVLCVVFICSVSGKPPLYGLVGLKVTLKPDVTGTKKLDEILWKHNGNKVVEFDGRKQQEFSLFENRVTLDWISAELSITDLTLDDSGVYELKIYADKVLKLQTLNLVVLEKLAKPNITCERSNDGEEATLTCSLESKRPQYLMYEWIYHGPGQWLTVPLSDKSTKYTCMVRNPLSNATATFIPTACYPDKGVSALTIRLIFLVVVLVAAILLGLLAAVLLGIICCKGYNKDLNNEKPHTDEESHLVHKPTVPSSQRLGGSVRQQVQEFKKNPHIRNLFSGTATEPLDPSHSDQEAEPGLNNEAPQHKHSNPPSEPAASSAQQPVSLSHDDTNMTSTCDEPDNKNDHTDKVNGQSQMPPEDQQKQLHKDGGEEPPAKETVRPLGTWVPAVGTKDTTEHSKSANSDQVTDVTEAENVKLSECEKNNDPNKKSQIGKAVSDQTESDNNQSQSPPNPEKPDQSSSLLDSPDATHSDLDQQTQDKVECDSPKCEEQSDNNTTVSKENNGKEEGDTDDNEDQCSGKEKQPDKESDDEDTRLEQSDEDGDDEDTEETMLVEQSAEESESKDTVEIGLQQSDKESDDEDTRSEESDEDDDDDEDTEETMLVK